MLNEFDSLCELIATPDADWKKREDALKRISSSLSVGNAESIEALNKNPKGIALQLSDLRSGLVKLASESVLSLAASKNKHKANPEKFIDAFLRDANLYKALASANKVIANHASAAFNSLFESGLVNFVSLEPLFAQAKTSKSGQLKEKIAAGMASFVQNSKKNPKALKLRPEQAEWLRKSAEFLSNDPTGAVRASAKLLQSSLVEEEKTTIKRPEGNFGEFWTAVRNEAMPMKDRVEIMKRCDKSKLALRITFDEFRELVNVYENAKNLELRKILSEILERAEIRTYGEPVLEFLVGAGLGGKKPLVFLEQNLLKSFTLDEILNCFLASNSSTSLALLSKKLSMENFEALLQLPKSKASAIAFVGLLAKNSVKPSLKPEFKTQCFNTLLPLMKIPLVKKAIDELDCKQSLYELVSKNDPTFLAKTPTKQMIADSPSSRRLISTSSDDDSIFTSDFDQMLKGDSSQKAQFARNFKLAIEKLRAKTLSEQVMNRSLRRGATLLKSYFSTTSDQTTLPFIISLAEFRADDPQFISLLHDTLLTAFGRDKSMREPAIQIFVLLPFKNILLSKLIERMENPVEESSIISDSLKVFSGLLKAMKFSNQAESFEEMAKSFLQRLVSVMKARLLTHYEVNVRKNTVQLLVEMYYFFHREVFAYIIGQFSPEHQKLVRLYIEKSQN